MNYRSFLYLILFSAPFMSAVSPRPSNAPFALPSFGSTHFIVGFPHQAPQAKLIEHASKTVTHSAGSHRHVQEARVLFSPDDDVQKELVGLIETEKNNIRIAIYSFTDKEIAHALIAAKKRGVSVEVVTDPSNIYAQYSKIALLEEAGIPVFVYNPEHEKANHYALMHHKFAVFDCCTPDKKSLVWTGSFNFTKSAGSRNQENVVILEHEKTVKRFVDQFDRLKTRCRNCERKMEVVAKKDTEDKKNRFMS